MRAIKYSIALIAIFIGSGVFAQSEVFNIGGSPTYSGCDAIMHDSNGGLTPYSANSNDQITLCAPAPETQINLYFIGFDLSEGDSLSVFDGTNTGAPLIGIFSGDSLLFETISSTNIDGCLTILFNSNADDQVGDFSVRISCGVPCDYPVALIQEASDTIKICPGETVTFNGSESTWTEGANLASWTWDFGDGTENTTSWPTVTHTFPDFGGYRVRLYLTDDNDCSSANIPEKIVFVSTPYDFNLESTAEIFCVGAEIYIGTDGFVGDPNSNFTGEVQNGNTLTWVETQSVSFDNGVYIPDNEGCLYAELTFNQFGNAVIDAESDIASVFFNMEHSFVGDIIINVICPTGEVLNLWPEAGGSGTFLGEPIDDETGVPGVGYDYSFSPNSTGPTWLDGMGSFGSTIPAGDYTAAGTWADLFGCPLNGTWQLEVCDVVGADDGWVFEFGIQFAPEFYPDVLQFTPSVGNSCDSSYWENPGLFTSVGDDCDWAIFEPSVGGVYDFTYHVINDFGCEYTDNIQITAIDAPVVNVEDQVFCGTGLIIPAAITNPIPNVNYTYAWSPATGLNSTAIANPTANNLTNDITYTVEVSVPGITGCEGSDTCFVYVPLALVPTTPAEQFFCEIDFPMTLESATQVNPNAQYQWVWNNENGSNVVGNEQNYDAVNYGQFILSVSEDDCNTEITTTYYVTPPPPANAGTDFYYCGQNINLNGSVVSPIPGLQYGYSWQPADLLGNPNQWNSMIVANLDTLTRFYLSIYPLLDPTCISTDSVDVLMPELPLLSNLEYMSPCYEELPYTVYGAAQTQALVTYHWQFSNQDTIIDFGNNPSVTSDLSGFYVLTLTEPNCGTSVTQNINVAPQACTLFFPNIMTPNGDGDNDTFNVRGVARFSGSTCQIFNRWGNLVFEDEDYDGTWNGGEQPEGTYYYIVGIKKQGEYEYHKGDLTIIR